MNWFPAWVPFDWEGRVLLLVGAGVLFMALFAWTAANLRIAWGGDWLAAAMLQAGAVLLIGSASCGRQIVPQFEGAGSMGYHWLGREWWHRTFDLYGLDGFAWMAAGGGLLVAAVGLAAIGFARSHRHVEGAS